MMTMMTMMEGVRLFLHIVLLAAAVSGKFRVHSSDSQQVVEVGSDAVLQCSLSALLGPAGLKVHWFRSLLHATVFLMKDGKEEKDQQSAEYAGRASLRNGTGSTELTLLLRRVVLTDADTYHCFVEDPISNEYDEAVIELAVIGSGSLPVMAVSLKDGAVMVSFLSSNWFPKPEMHWELEGVPVTTDTAASISNQTDGLFTLESSILLRDRAQRRLYGAARHPVTGKSTGLFITISEALQRRNGKLSSEVDWRTAVMNPEFITFCPETAHPELSVTADSLTLMNRPPPAIPADPSNARFETERCCLALPAFTHGCHYWEVEVGGGLEWAVGVASPQLQRRGEAYMFRPQMLIWCIARFTDVFTALDVKEQPLKVSDGTVLDKVGVYLDLSGPRRLVFYDPHTWDKLYTFTDVGGPRDSLVPFFWLGKNGNEIRLKQVEQRANHVNQ